MRRYSVRNFNKKLFRICMLFGCICFFSAISPAFAKTRVVRVGVFKAAPMVFTSPDGPEGLFIDTLEYIAAEEEWKLIYVEDVWKNHLIALEKGDIDLLPALGYTKERDQVYDYNNHALFIDSGVVYISSSFIPHTIYDLNGKSVAGLENSIFTTRFVEYADSFGIHCSMILTKDNHEVMRLIQEGKVDAGVCIYSLGNVLMNEYRVSETPISFSPIALHYAVPAGKNDDLLDTIDKYMKRMEDSPDSVYNQSYLRWTRKDEGKAFYKIFAWITVITLGLILLLLLWNLTLNHKVKKKTIDLKKEISERKEAEHKIGASLKEKEILIKELFHRTKNTLQLVCGLLSIQASDYSENAELQKVVKDTEERIQAISLIQEMLYKAQDLAHINIKEYITALVLRIQSGYGKTKKNIDIRIDCDDINIQIDTAVPVGILINELLTNSYKYAFVDRDSGKIAVTFKRRDRNSFFLEVEDNGGGVDENYSFKESSTLGLKLVHDIVEFQLKGTIQFECKNGVRCSITLHPVSNNNILEGVK